MATGGSAQGGAGGSSQGGAGAGGSAQGGGDPVALCGPSLQKVPQNPVLTNGPDSYDAVKTGPRALLGDVQNGYRMWYEAVPAGNESSVGYATSSNALDWTKQGEVLQPGLPWEGGASGEVSPNSILLVNGSYWLYYHSYDGLTRRIGYATSPDGLTWTKAASNPILAPGASGAFDDAQIAEPRVFAVPTGYRMYYSGLSGADNMWRLGSASSADGIAWSKDAQNPLFGPVGGAGHGIVQSGEQWEMWYSPNNGSLAYASSNDGLSWTDGPGNPVLLPGAGADVDGMGDSVSAFRDGPVCRVLYACFNFQGTPSRSICMATTP